MEEWLCNEKPTANNLPLQHLARAPLSHCCRTSTSGCPFSVLSLSFPTQYPDSLTALSHLRKTDSSTHGLAYFLLSKAKTPTISRTHLCRKQENFKIILDYLNMPLGVLYQCKQLIKAQLPNVCK